MITIKYLGGDNEDEQKQGENILKPQSIKEDIFIGLVQGHGIGGVAKEFQEEVWKRDSAGHFWLLICECNIGEKIQFLSRKFGKRMSFHFVGRTEEEGWDKGINEDIDSFLNRSGKIKSLFKLGACSFDLEFAEKILARMICLQSQ